MARPSFKTRRVGWLGGLGLGLLGACQPAAPGEDPSAEVTAASQALAVPTEQAAQEVSSPAGIVGPMLRISLFDVGQGDGALIELPNGKNLAIDGGPRKDDFATDVENQGVTRLDAMILSHAHDDHYAGLTGAMGFLPDDCVRRVYDPGYNHTAAGYQRFKTEAGCRYGSLGTGMSLSLDPAVEIRVLSAYNHLTSSDTSHGINNTSVVVQIRYGRFSMLFTGDAEQLAEKAEVLKGSLASTVLKLGHHGSCTASGTSFLRDVAPQVALISVAAGNSYGLPHCQTIGKLRARKAAGLRWYRTDVNGPITIETDGDKYLVTKDHGVDSSEACPRNCASPTDF